jgi:galactokinase
MDQFVASLGKHGEALFIDCRNNNYSIIPLFDGYRIVVADTLKQRELASSAYNERKSECQKAVTILREYYPYIEALRDVNIEMLENHWEALPKILASRAKHVVTENRRVLESVEFLKRDDVEEFGQLMYDSHESLRYAYQVSCLELDTLVEATMNMEYVMGARLTGAGFGGCTVNIIEEEKVETFKSDIKQKYEETLRKDLRIYLV